VSGHPGGDGMVPQFVKIGDVIRLDLQTMKTDAKSKGA
jgi:hypothetical protein